MTGSKLDELKHSNGFRFLIEFGRGSRRICLGFMPRHRLSVIICKIRVYFVIITRNTIAVKCFFFFYRCNQWRGIRQLSRTVRGPLSKRQYFTFCAFGVSMTPRENARSRWRLKYKNSTTVFIDHRFSRRRT